MGKRKYNQIDNLGKRKPVLITIHDDVWKYAKEYCQEKEVTFSYLVESLVRIHIGYRRKTKTNMDLDLTYERSTKDHYIFSYLIEGKKYYSKVSIVDNKYELILGEELRDGSNILFDPNTPKMIIDRLSFMGRDITEQIKNNIGI